jgi:ABC-type antimicrobial peptide transport system permease subunit
MDLVTSATHASFGNSRNDWRSGSLVSTFAVLPDPKAIATLEKSLQSYAALHNEAQPAWKIERFSFQSFKSIAKSSDRDMAGYVHGRELNSNPRGVSVIGVAVLSLFLLLIACFNFTNISIAFAGGRLKEIGIRKVMGGLRMQLVKQFLAENVILCLIASLLACLFVAFLLPAFNSLLGLQLKMHLGDYAFWLLLLAMPLVTAVVSGLYPALYISGFEPVAILKGQRMFGSSNWFSRLLLVVQFALSCLALVLGIALSKNAAYQKQVDYGYNIQEVAVAQVSSASEYQTLANALAGNPKIKQIAGTVHQVGEGATETIIKKGNIEAKVLAAKIGGKAYLETMGITLMQGRHFHAGASLDEKQSLIVNQTFADQLQLLNPVGQTVWMDSAYSTIVGVVKDYKEYGQHGRVPPIAMLPASTEAYQYLVLQTNRASLNGVYKEMQDTWHRLLPGKPFNGFLQKELIDKEVYMNAGFESVAYFLAFSTIMLSASGVFALVSLNIIRRRKEIGMRKILGASIMQLILIINKDFIRVLFIAFIIGSALGFLIIDKIVFRFIYVYHPDLGFGVFLLTLLILLLSGALTIGLKVFRAASANPVNSLRTE